MRISDWSSDVCSSDLSDGAAQAVVLACGFLERPHREHRPCHRKCQASSSSDDSERQQGHKKRTRSDEHTSELQSLMRISYAVFCLKKKMTIIHYLLNQTNHKTTEPHPKITRPN